jgi:hypothetical protein
VNVGHALEGRAAVEAWIDRRVEQDQVLARLVIAPDG